MNRRLSRIAPWQAAKLFAVAYFFFGVLMAVPLILFSALVRNPLGGETKLQTSLLVFLPLVYALSGMIFVPLGCWIYNVSAKLVGGLHVQVTDHGDS